MRQAGKTTIVAIVNPVAGQRVKADIRQALCDLATKADVVVRETEHAGHGEDIARELDPAKTDAVVAVGGDGTVNEVLNGLIGRGVPLGILPFGTTNVLAREIGIHGSRERAVATVLNGNTSPVCVGKANSRYFLMMAGVGFDADVVCCMNTELKRSLHTAAYVVAGLKMLCRVRPRQLRVTVDGTTVGACSAVIGNSSFYGGSFRITPNARLAEPAFEVCLFKKNSRMDIIRYCFGVLFRRHMTYTDVELCKGRHIRVEGSDSMHVQLDGDCAGRLPLDVTVADTSIDLLTPKSGYSTVRRFR